MGQRSHLGHALSSPPFSRTPAPASRCFDISLSHQAFCSSLKVSQRASKTGKWTIFLCFCPPPFLHACPSYYSPQATVKIFLAKEGIPSTLPDEQMRGGPEEWVGGWGAAWGASASVRLDYREVGGLRSSVPSRSLWLAFYRLPVPPEMNQRVGVTRWFSFRWMAYCIICRCKKIINS